MNKFSTFLLFCISFFQISLGQTSVTSYDGYSYAVGDTIQLGYPQYSSQNYEFIVYPQIEYNATFYKKLPKGNFPFTFAVIEKITPTEQNNVSSLTEKSPLLQVRSINKPDSILFINLDYAIAQKELARNLKPLQQGEMKLETHTLLAFYHKIHKKEIQDEELLQYLSSKDRELAKECNDNRFKFNKIKGEWKSIFDKEMANLDFNKVYFMEQPVKHSEYDFEKSGYWISYDSKFFDLDKKIIPFAPYYFLLQNYAKKNFLRMNADVAEKFETTQKGISYYSSYGTLYARIFFRFSKEPVVFPKTDRGIAMSVMYKDELMNVEVQKVAVFDNDSYLYNYVGTIE